MVNGDQSLFELHEKIRACRLCHLSKMRKNAVPGEGPDRATIMFIGEGPGKSEDIEGRPFVGRAGRFLEESLQSIGLRREDVFIANVLKCRPIELAGNSIRDRRPTEEEVAVCSPYLDKQIELVDPKVICPLGDTAKAYVFRKYGLKEGMIGKLHGKRFKVGERTVIPMYHPAAALYDAKLRDVILGDFRKLQSVLHQSKLEHFTLSS